MLRWRTSCSNQILFSRQAGQREVANQPTPWPTPSRPPKVSLKAELKQKLFLKGVHKGPQQGVNKDLRWWGITIRFRACYSLCLFILSHNMSFCCCACAILHKMIHESAYRPRMDEKTRHQVSHLGRLYWARCRSRERAE